MDTYSLFELNEHLRRVIALNFQEPLWVRAEIAQVKQSRRHFYLDLVEKAPDGDEILAQIPAVIWAKTAWSIQRKLKEIFSQLLQDGMEVRLRVRVDFHERYGLKLMVEDIDPSFTLGNIEARRREIITALHAEGMIGLNARIRPPMVVQKIAILSGEHAAGYHDFRKHIEHNPWHFHFWLELYPVAVQGALVESQVLDALDKISHAAHHYDCVVIIRGGGSRLDLAAFDSYAIGRAIAMCRLPVFTGIGHEIDQSVADAVAHTSLKTPTAVADHILELNARYATKVEELFADITAIAGDTIQKHHTELRHVSELVRRITSEFLSRKRLLLDQHIPALRNAYQQHLQKHRERLTYLYSMLDTLNPDNLLRRGFSITSINGKRVISSDGVQPGDRVTTHLYEGKIESTVNSHE